MSWCLLALWQASSWPTQLDALHVVLNHFIDLDHISLKTAVHFVCFTCKLKWVVTLNWIELGCLPTLRIVCKSTRERKETLTDEKSREIIFRQGVHLKENGLKNKERCQLTLLVPVWWHKALTWWHGNESPRTLSRLPERKWIYRHIEARTKHQFTCEWKPSSCGAGRV